MNIVPGVPKVNTVSGVHDGIDYVRGRGYIAISIYTGQNGMRCNSAAVPPL